MMESALQMPLLTQTMGNVSNKFEIKHREGVLWVCSPGRGGKRTARTPRKMSAEHIVIGSTAWTLILRCARHRK